MRWSRVAVLVVLAALGAGCRRAPARTLTEEALAAQLGVPIPAVPATRLGPPALRLRILVGAAALDVDAVDLLASWPENRRARLLEQLPEDEAAALPFVHRGLVRFAGGHLAPPDTLGPGQLEIRALTDVLTYARELALRYAKLVEAETEEAVDPGFRPEVNVYAAADTPFAILAAVLYTVYQSSCQATLVARGPGGDVALPISAPPPEVAVAPRIAFRPDGLAVSLDALHPLPRAATLGPSAPHPGADPGHLDRPILAADRACPSVPLRDGAPDLGRLRDLVGRIRARIPVLDTVLLVPALDTPWRSVAGVAATAFDAGLPRLAVGLPRAGHDGPPVVPCSRGIDAEELGPEDMPRGRF